MYNMIVRYVVYDVGRDSIDQGTVFNQQVIS